MSLVTLIRPMDCSSPGSSVHGILQARILEWAVVSYSTGSSQPRDLTHLSYVSCIGSWALYHECHLIGQPVRLSPAIRDCHCRSYNNNLFSSITDGWTDHKNESVKKVYSVVMPSIVRPESRLNWSNFVACCLAYYGNNLMIWYIIYSQGQTLKIPPVIPEWASWEAFHNLGALGSLFALEKP